MKKPLLAVPLKFGALASGLLMLLFIVLFYANRHPLGIPIVLDVRLLILPLFMFLAMKEFRDVRNNNSMHFWQGLTVGAITFMLLGVLMAVFLVLFSAVDPDFLASYINERLTLIADYKLQLIEQLVEETLKYQLAKLPLTTSFDLAIDYFLKTTMIGIVLNIIIAIILRKQPNLN